MLKMLRRHVGLESFLVSEFHAGLNRNWYWPWTLQRRTASAPRVPISMLCACTSAILQWGNKYVFFRFSKPKIHCSTCLPTFRASCPTYYSALPASRSMQNRSISLLRSLFLSPGLGPRVAPRPRASSALRSLSLSLSCLLLACLLGVWGEGKRAPKPPTQPRYASVCVWLSRCET